MSVNIHINMHRYTCKNYDVYMYSYTCIHTHIYIYTYTNSLRVAGDILIELCSGNKKLAGLWLHSNFIKDPPSDHVSVCVCVYA